MAPVLPATAPSAPDAPPSSSPRVVVYYQTHHTHHDQKLISIKPLLGRDGGGPSATHIVVAALHINNAADNPAHHLTLNDHPPSHPRFNELWTDLALAQARGVYVLGLLGGAAKGSYERLDTARASPADFEHNYAPLYRLICERRLDGLDLDVEEAMSLQGIVHLIDRLRADFGPRFLITMAPVAAALFRPHDPRCNLSGFSYADVERLRGRDIAWYHAQFYFGWGDAATAHMYASMTGLGPGPASDLGGPGAVGAPATGPGASMAWPASRVVMGLVTSSANGPGFVPLDAQAEVLLQLMAATEAAQFASPAVPGSNGGSFGGVSGWEYFNSMPGGEASPWEWAEWMSAILGTRVVADGQAGNLQRLRADGSKEEIVASTFPGPCSPSDDSASSAARATPKFVYADLEGPDAPVPDDFLYETDTEAA